MRAAREGGDERGQRGSGQDRVATYRCLRARGGLGPYEAVQGLFRTLFPEAGDLLAKFAYAVVVTAVVVFVTVRLGRLSERLKKDEEQNKGEQG